MTARGEYRRARQEWLRALAESDGAIAVGDSDRVRDAARHLDSAESQLLPGACEYRHGGCESVANGPMPDICDSCAKLEHEIWLAGEPD